MRKVIHAYEVVYPNAIRVLKGATVLILREETNPEWAGWLWCRSDDGQEGWISKDFLEVNGSNATMARDYDAREVAVQSGELVQVLKEEHGWVWVKKSDSTEGWIPLANLENEKPLNVRLAKSDDIDQVVSLILELSRWLKEKGIQQWRDPFPREVFEGEVSQGELFILHEQGNVIASVALSTEAGELWDDTTEAALYLNRLAVSKSHSGKRIGEAMMKWAEGEAKQRGVNVLRLVCDSKNPFLPGYYKRLGYESRGTKLYEPWKMTFVRYEKCFQID